MEEKPRYIKCPRCELNYILSNQEYCEVCKAEMKAGYQDEEELDELLLEDEATLCPHCKANYITDESKGMCDTCYEENSTSSDTDDNVDWRSFVDKEDNDDELDLLPVENDDEIDEEMDSTFAQDLDDDFNDNFDEEEEFGDYEDDEFDSPIGDEDFDDDDEDDEFEDDDDEDDEDDLMRK